MKKAKVITFGTRGNCHLISLPKENNSCMLFMEYMSKNITNKLRFYDNINENEIQVTIENYSYGRLENICSYINSNL